MLNYGISDMQTVKVLIILTEFVLSDSSLLLFMQRYYIEIGYNFPLTDFYLHTITITFLVGSLTSIIR